MSRKKKSQPDSFRSVEAEKEVVESIVKDELKEQELIEGEPKEGWRTRKPAQGSTMKFLAMITLSSPEL